MVNKGGRRNSQRAETWAQNVFDEWRLEKGYSAQKSIADLSEVEDPRPFVNMLAEFTLEVRKQDGSMYPPTSIQCLLRAVNRIIRDRQGFRSCQSGLAVVPIDILKDPLYQRVKLAGDEAVRRSLAAGLGKTRKCSDILTPAEEVAMLALPENQASNPTGANYHFAWYCTSSFFDSHPC